MYYTDIINILSGLLTPLIAIVTMYIMIQQYRMEKRNFRYQLFESRHSIYDAVMFLLSEVMRKGNANPESISKFMIETRDSHIFFEADISEYISQLYSNAVELEYINSELDDRGLPIGEKRSELARENTKVKKWFRDQNEVCKNKFKPYIDFTKR
jgi:hypothetical protein